MLSYQVELFQFSAKIVDMKANQNTEEIRYMNLVCFFLVYSPCLFITVSLRDGFAQIVKERMFKRKNDRNNILLQITACLRFALLIQMPSALSKHRERYPKWQIRRDE